MGKPTAEWKLEDAKAHFSELVRRTAPKPTQAPFVEFMESLYVIDLELDFSRKWPSEDRAILFS